MIEWRKAFRSMALKQGQIYFEDKRVRELSRTQDHVTGVVLYKQRYEVSISIKGGEIIRASCSCPVSKGLTMCAHMAAVLLAAEEEEKKENGEKEAKAEDEKGSSEPRQIDISEYLKTKTQETNTAQKEAAAGDCEQPPEDPAQDEAREAKRLEREQRKAEKRQQQEEARRREEDERRKANERIAAEQARRDAIRRKKEEEKQRREEKRREQAEAAKRLAEQKEKEEKKRAEEMIRKAKEKVRRQEEEKRMREEAKKRLEEANRTKQRELEEADRRANQKIRRSTYELYGNPVSEATPQEDEDDRKKIQDLVKYAYFDEEKILASVTITPEAAKKSNAVLAAGNIVLDRITENFQTSTLAMCARVIGKCKVKESFYPMSVVCSKDAVIDRQCGCPTCQKSYAWYYSRYDDEIRCENQAAFIRAAANYLGNNNVGDTTDYRGMLFLSSFQKDGRMLPGMETKKGSLRVVPRMFRAENGISAGLRVGMDKLYVVKKINEFYEAVQNGETLTYGSSTKFDHSLENFTDKGREWVRFIGRIMQEEKDFRDRMYDNGYHFGRDMELGNSFGLYGWRLDKFFELLDGESIECEDKTLITKTKRFLKPMQMNPKIHLKLSAYKPEGIFEGIQVEGDIPEIFDGLESCYYIDENGLYQAQREFSESLRPLLKLAKRGEVSFRIGRNYMSNFFSVTLPKLKELAQVEENDLDEIEKYLLPPARFVFYMDAENNDVFCQPYSRYGSDEYALVQTQQLTTSIFEGERFRDVLKENDILSRVRKWFPVFDADKRSFCCEGDEERIYRLMREGVNDLLQLGEVRATPAFKKRNVVRRIKASVGVSLSEGLLGLEVTADDVSREELLELLRSCRAKKKYYRLKDGSFADVEDESLISLAEMIDALHLPPKEFIKGKIHIPAYRSLYLDRMLEENEELYSTRDSRFRQIIKDFKTVKESDFEEPESLSSIMREYQKNGFKWLKTLENCHFGGILADDMGLGKTLQMISLFLKAKEENKEGTALVVSPASLVFNWGEEFSRFAPALNVVLVSGTQEERRQKIEDYRKADVLVTSYDLLKRDISFYEDKEFLYQVIDEAQYIKNHTTAAAKAVKIIKSAQRFALTGTPIENRLSELWSIFDFLMPGFLYGYDVFRKELETPIVKYKEEGAMTRLKKMVSPFILRRLKTDVLKDLPEKLEESRYVKISGMQQKLYDGQVEHMRELLARTSDEEFSKARMKLLAELMRIRQICCDPSLCFENYNGGSAKLEACIDLVQSAIDGGHRMLLFSQFTSMLDILKERLGKAGITYMVITGETPSAQRLKLVKAFNEGDTPVFLISLKAGGVGLNLTGADVVIHYDPWWNAAVQNQATDRAHRIGQTKKVTVYKLIVKGSIEERIEKLQESKKELAEQIVGTVSGSDTGSLSAMTKEDLLELLG